MKRVISLIAVMMLFVACMVPAAFAAETSPAKASVSGDTNVPAKPGDTVTVKFYINMTDVANGDFYISYPSDVMTLTSLVPGSIPGFTANANPANGGVTFAGTANTTTSATAAVATFTIKDTATTGVYSIPVVSGYVSDVVAMVEGQFTPGAGSIAVTAPDPEPSTPDTEPSTPDTEPSTPDTEPSTPDTEPSTPVTEPSTPETEPSTPETEPSTPGDDKDDEPKTGDITPQIVFFGVAVMTLTAAVFFSMKRKAAK